MRISVGTVDQLPVGRCVAVGDGSVVVARVGEVVVAFQNRCLHQDSRLEGGLIENGRLTCPLHFWRYEVETGRHIGGRGNLDMYPVEVVDGEVYVEAPDPAPPMGMREMMLRHAKEWERGD
ncbi:MAG: Rieske (2Fe-2S) protein [Acidimicrobiia bacterium]|nr:Rieske (2Fe-2S) protein [Acidimicrobiia bacterium]MDH4307099.1 Rieske (2Fe-2S) protein [Acidimicrobiia bacterium]